MITEGRTTEPSKGHSYFFFKCYVKHFQMWLQNFSNVAAKFFENVVAKFLNVNLHIFSNVAAKKKKQLWPLELEGSVG